MLVLKCLFGQIRVFRRMIGGEWARTTAKTEIGRGLWLPYAPVSDPVTWGEMVSSGLFDYEDYR